MTYYGISLVTLSAGRPEPTGLREAGVCRKGEEGMGTIQVFLGLISEEILALGLNLLQKVMVAQIIPCPQGCPCLIPGTCESVKLQGKWNSADIIKSMDLKMARLSWIIWVT